MEPLITVLKDKDRDKLLDGFGIALEATTPGPITRIGADQEIVHLPDHAFLLEMTTLWTLPLSSAKLQMTKNARNTERQVDVSNVENKVILFAIVPTKRHALIQLTPFKSKTTRNRPPLKLLPHLCLSLRG